MPTFGKKDSPTLRKMELNNGRGLKSGRGGKFNMGNVLGDPFTLATLGIALCGWLIAFISSIVASSGHRYAYPNFCWWSLAYMCGCIVGIFVTVATNSVYTYHVAVVGFLAAALVFNTSAVNSLIYEPEASKEAGAAGFILLSMVSILWIFYYGSQPQASHRQTIDSFALHKDHAPSRRASRPMTQSYRGADSTAQPASQGQQMFSSSALPLAGFETSSPVSAFPGGRPGESKRESAAYPAPLNPQQPPAPQTPQPQQDSAVAQPMEYPYRAKAIYTYEANPDDGNEISFTKHEVLEVSDVSGRWWQARKDNGETGIAPSNYLILL